MNLKYQKFAHDDLTSQFKRNIDQKDISPEITSI